MAENSVYINGIDKDALKDALDGVPAWATQDTAVSIETILKNTLKIQTQAFSELVKKATAGNNSPDAKALNDEFSKLTKDLHDERPKDLKYNKELQNQRTKEKKWWDDESKSVSGRIAASAVLTKIGLELQQVYMSNIKTYDDLTAAGINVIGGFDGVKDGFQSLRQLTAETGVRFTELSASMQKYSSAVNSFGVGKFSKTVGAASSGLAKFGFSSKESADLLGAMLSAQQNVTDVNNKTVKESTKDLDKFAENIFILSKTTGISTAAMIANIESLSHSTEANLLAGQVGEKSAESMTTFLASFKNQDVARQMLKLMTDPIKPLNETFQNLQKAGLGGFAQTFTTFQESLKGMPDDVKASAMKSFVEAHRNELDADKQRLTLLKQAGVEGAAASLDFIVGLQQSTNSMKIMTEDEKKRSMASNEASKKFENALEKFKSLLLKAFGPTAAMLNLFAGALSAVNFVLGGVISIFDKLSDGISFLLDKLGISANIDLTAWIGLGAIVYALASSFKVFGVVIKDLIVGLKGKLFGSAAKKAGNWSTSLGADGSGGAGQTAGKAAGGFGSTLGSLGKGIAQLGKGLGSGIGGLLKNALSGLADGLTKLGTPKVMLGIASLGLMAGVIWVTAKALKEFIGLDWKQLELAGAALVGLGAVGYGLGKAAVPIIEGAIALGIMGAALWVVGKATQQFIGIDWKQLEIAGAAIVGLGVIAVAFGAASALMLPGIVAMAGLAAAAGLLGIAINQVGTGFTTFGVGIQTISTALDHFTGISKLKDIVATINQLSLTKAAAFAALSLVSLPALSPPSPATSPLTTPKASGLNSPSEVSTKEKPAATTAGGETGSVPGKEKATAGNGINSAIEHQSSILEQILQSTNNLVSVNKDILKYARIQA